MNRLILLSSWNSTGFNRTGVGVYDSSGNCLGGATLTYDSNGKLISTVALANPGSGLTAAQLLAKVKKAVAEG